MIPDRRRAMRRQRERGNAPKETRMTDEERQDFGFYLTGLRYRARLDKKLQNSVNYERRETQAADSIVLDL